MRACLALAHFWVEQPENLKWLDTAEKKAADAKTVSIREETQAGSAFFDALTLKESCANEGANTLEMVPPFPNK